MSLTTAILVGVLVPLIVFFLGLVILLIHLHHKHEQLRKKSRQKRALASRPKLK